ncbi:uncharacterized protein LOC141665311 [Apium graveolens]|uniref:uncharacterized protein LOC141665311 n=1 Tax=Apium graveolens TaxID=4045 RepID=UPI003D79FC51
MKGSCVLDNQWVVPYNRDLLVKYNCHINIEICCHARSLKYLFKYCLKCHDRATVEISSQRRESANQEEVVVDEINAYFDGWYICASEADYRVFSFPIHYRSIFVLRLSFHLPGERSCTFTEKDNLEKVVRREQYKQSQPEAFFHLNQNYMYSRQFTYDEIPQYYVWNETDRIWTMRKKGNQIGRLLYTHHSAGELWYLRLLLSNVRGPTSFDALKTINGVCCRTFKEACKQLGLLDDDNEWHSVLKDCSNGGFLEQIRQLFVHIIVNCQVTDLKKLWEQHWKHIVDDLLRKRQVVMTFTSAVFSDMQLQYYALAEIDKLLNSIGRSLAQFKQLPQPPSMYLQSGINNLVSKAGGVYFVYGSDGCGKTFVWKMLIYKLRSLGLIVLPVASSGIATTLMPGGRTAHSWFRIPIMLDDCSSCGIHHDSDIAELIKHTDLIIWDGASMQHHNAFECLDHSLRDIIKAVDPKRFSMPFGGITVVLGGDFRHILPVINQGSRGDVVSATITRSPLWLNSKILLLYHNMRLNQAQDTFEVEELRLFVEWVLKIGNGEVQQHDDFSKEYAEDKILIPSQLCAEFTYYSVDKAEDFGGTTTELSFAFPPEYLNSINVSGLPPYKLKLKEGVTVMLMRLKPTFDKLHPTVLHSCPIQVQIFRKWKDLVTDEGSNTVVNVIAIDEQAQRMHICIPPSTGITFYDMLHTGKIYELSNFSISPYDVNVCLWDEFAKCTNVAMNDDAFYPILPFIIVMSSCIMVKDLCSGVITLSDTSSTKLYFNYDVPRVFELRDGNTNSIRFSVMSPSYHTLFELTTEKIVWSIRVRAQAVWKGINQTTNEFRGFNILFIDDQDCRIHAFISEKISAILRF